MDMWVSLDETGPTKCSSESEESSAEQELNGLEEGEDVMTDEEGEGVGGEVEAGTAGWRVRVGPRNKLTAREGKNTMQHTCRSVTGAHTA